MHLPYRDTSELVVGMTLAEIFLFVLFVVWWSNTATTVEGGAPPTPTIDELQSEIQILKGQVAQLSKENQDFKTTIEALRAMLKPSDNSFVAWAEALKRRDEEVATIARRGAPKCAEANMLVHIRAINGTVELILTEDAAALAKVGSWNPGQRLTDEAMIATLLRDINVYSRAEACRFDYRLTYATEVDFHDAKLRFEAYLYPGGINRTQ